MTEDGSSSSEGGTTPSPTATPPSFDFHYVIAHCFARVVPSPSNTPLADDIGTIFADGRHGKEGLAFIPPPPVLPSDDAVDAQWMSLSDLNELDGFGLLSGGVIDVIERAEELDRLGALSTTTLR
jgi:hypothetical protein